MRGPTTEVRIRQNRSMRRPKLIRVEYEPHDLSPGARAVWPERESTPNPEAVAAFLSAVWSDPAVGVEVLAHLRRHAAGRGDPLLAYVGGLMAIAALAVAMSPGAISRLPLEWQIIVASIGGAFVLWVLVFASGLVIDIDVRARYAAAWVGAFEDGLAASPSVRARQRRSLRRLRGKLA